MSAHGNAVYGSPDSGELLMIDAATGSGRAVILVVKPALGK